MKIIRGAYQEGTSFITRNCIDDVISYPCIDVLIRNMGHFSLSLNFNQRNTLQNYFRTEISKRINNIWDGFVFLI